MNSTKIKKTLILLLPYIILGLVCTNLGEAWRMAEGADFGNRLVSCFSMLAAAFGNPLPSLHPLDLALGTICGGSQSSSGVRTRNITATTKNTAPPGGGRRKTSNPSWIRSSRIT